MTIKPYKFVSVSFHGDTIYADVSTLYKAFGPYHDSDPAKVNYEWSLILNDEIPFSIYDWKEPWLDEYTETYFHIGARDEKESEIVKDAVNNYLKNYKTNGTDR